MDRAFHRHDRSRAHMPGWRNPLRISSSYYNPAKSAKVLPLGLSVIPVPRDAIHLHPDRFVELLPNPLKTHVKLAEDFVRLVEEARSLPFDQLFQLSSVLRRESKSTMPGLNRQFGYAMALVASALENCEREESFLLGHFRRLLDVFAVFSEYDRGLLLSVVHGILDACSVVASSEH